MACRCDVPLRTDSAKDVNTNNPAIRRSPIRHEGGLLYRVPHSDRQKLILRLVGMLRLSSFASTTIAASLST
jgi:hypothetical protein